MSWPNFKVLPKHSPGQTKENHETLSQYSPSPGLSLNPVSPENESGVGLLTTQPRRSVKQIIGLIFKAETIF
jgi:hypothetical protein